MHEKKINHTFEDTYYYKKTLISTKLEDTYFESAHIGDGKGRFLYSSIQCNYTDIDVTHALNQLSNLVIIESSYIANSSEIVDSYTKHNPAIESSFISNAMKLPQVEVPEKFYEITNMFL